MVTMMLDALVGTLPRLPQNNRAATVCRCVYSVYTATHGGRAPWEITGETPQQCEERVKSQPVTIIDTTAEVISEETSVRNQDRSARARPVAMPNMRRQGSVFRTNGKRMRSQSESG